MSDPAPENVYSVTLTVTVPAFAPNNPNPAIQQKQLNVLAATMQDAIGKAVATVPNSEARQCSLVCVVNVQ